MFKNCRLFITFLLQPFPNKKHQQKILFCSSPASLASEGSQPGTSANGSPQVPPGTLPNIFPGAKSLFGVSRWVHRFPCGFLLNLLLFPKQCLHCGVLADFQRGQWGRTLDCPNSRRQFVVAQAGEWWHVPFNLLHEMVGRGLKCSKIEYFFITFLLQPCLWPPMAFSQEISARDFHPGVSRHPSRRRPRGRITVWSLGSGHRF